MHRPRAGKVGRQFLPRPAQCLTVILSILTQPIWVQPTQCIPKRLNIQWDQRVLVNTSRPLTNFSSCQRHRPQTQQIHRHRPTTTLRLLQVNAPTNLTVSVCDYNITRAVPSRGSEGIWTILSLPKSRISSTHRKSIYEYL